MTQAASLQVTNPGEIASKGRKKRLRSIWGKKEHKARVKSFCEGKTCAWCGSDKNLTAHHPYIESYKGAYTDLELSGCIVLCNRCHFSLHKGLVLCPICKQHYHRVGAEMCKGCFLEKHPEIVAAREKFIRDQKERRRELNRQKAARARAWKKQHGTGGARG